MKIPFSFSTHENIILIFITPWKCHSHFHHCMKMSFLFMLPKNTIHVSPAWKCDSHSWKTKGWKSENPKNKSNNKNNNKAIPRAALLAVKNHTNDLWPKKDTYRSFRPLKDAFSRTLLFWSVWLEWQFLIVYMNVKHYSVYKARLSPFHCRCWWKTERLER